MKKLFKTSGFIAVLMLLLTGCGGVAIYNVQNASITQKEASVDTVFNAIKAAGYERGWRVIKVKPGLAKASINVRGRLEAVVEIPYTAKEYSINYISSTNLKYNPEERTIHRRYNNWIKNLNNSIQNQLFYLQQ